MFECKRLQARLGMLVGDRGAGDRGVTTKRRTAPTLHDVARRAGVSTATVSRALNAPALVTDATRELVLRTVDELGYTPHFGGRALVSNRSNTIGAVIPTMDNAIFARGLQAFQETLAAEGLTLLVASSGYDMDREFEQIRALVSRGIDGLLLIGVERAAKCYAFLDRRRIPYVLTWNYRAGGKACFVGFDNRQAARSMARAVIERGHRRIAMIAGITASNDRASDRVEGVRVALDEAGLSGRDMPIVEEVYSLGGGRRACARLLARTPRPTALICGNDVLAVGAIIEAKALGLRVPADVSVTGFDDIDLAEVSEPRLTTVHVPHRRMGEAAARVLLAARDGDAGGEGVALQTRLVVRESLAASP
jgi:LacI family transcriptional regulator